MWVKEQTKEKANGGKILVPDRNGFSPRCSTATTNSGVTYPNDEEFDPRRSSCSGASSGYSQSNDQGSPFSMSPWNGSPWTLMEESYQANGLIGSMVREDGHIYSLAASRDLLYTGSESKNIRVWKNRREYGGFKASSGLVKAIIISRDRVFTGHQDGKIRVWKVSQKNPRVHKRVGSLPRTRELLKRSLNPSNYVEVRRHKTALWIKHHDTVSCLSLDDEEGLLYSASWDKTVKVWRLATSKCLESIIAHDDAINAVVVGFDGLIFTGSADGTVKAWRREHHGKKTKHTFLQKLLSQECAVTALAVNSSRTVVYCGSSDGAVNFWEREKLLSHGGVLRGHKLAVLCLATAGCLVFSGSADKTICIWRRDGTSHACISVLQGHTGPVKCVAVEAEENDYDRDRRWILYTGSLDRSVKVWRVSEVAPELSQPPNLSPSPPVPTRARRPC